MKQKIEELNPEDIARLEAQRKWVREHYPPESELLYETLKGKIVFNQYNSLKQMDRTGRNY